MSTEGEVDTDYLTAWSLDQQRTGAAKADRKCSYCGHRWHGLMCEGAGTAEYRCWCETSMYKGKT